MPSDSPQMFQMDQPINKTNNFTPKNAIKSNHKQSYSISPTAMQSEARKKNQ
jgi:hypothetical protein